MGIVTGVVVLTVMCLSGWFIFVTYGEHYITSRTHVLVVPVMFLAIYAISVICSFGIGNYARVKVSGLANENAPDAALKPSVGFLMIAHGIPLVTLVVWTGWLARILHEGADHSAT